MKRFLVPLFALGAVIVAMAALVADPSPPASEGASPPGMRLPFVGRVNYTTWSGHSGNTLHARDITPRAGAADAWNGNVIAMAAGKVIFAGGVNIDCSKYGVPTNGAQQEVVIEHNIGGTRYMTVYRHLSAIAVKAGQTVASGQKVGFYGKTGCATGVHLHFDVYQGGTWGNRYSGTNISVDNLACKPNCIAVAPPVAASSPLTATITSPKPNETFSTSMRLAVTASGGVGGPVRFEFGAKYSDNPGKTAPYWHRVGDATPANGWAITWDTSAVPEQTGVVIHGWIVDAAGNTHNQVAGVNGLTVERAPLTATITSPQPNQTFSGAMRLAVTASGGVGGPVRFEFGAKYSDNPGVTAAYWHRVGDATPANGWAIVWDTSGVPEQSGVVIHGWIVDAGGNAHNQVPGIHGLTIARSSPTPTATITPTETPTVRPTATITPGEPRCLGDVNGDRTVNSTDLLLVALNFGRRDLPALDVNNDGVLNAADLGLVASKFGTCPGAA